MCACNHHFYYLTILFISPKKKTSDGSETSLTLNQIDSTSTLTDNQQTDNVPSLPAKKDKDEENKLLAPTVQEQPQCDDNQNNVNNRIVSMQNLQNLDNLNIGAAGDRVRCNLKQLLALYAKLTRQLMEFTETKANEQSSYKAKCDEMSSQVCFLINFHSRDGP